MKFALFALACLLLLDYSNSSLAQTQTIFTTEQARFFERQPFFATKAANRQGLRHIGVEVIALEEGFTVSNVLDGYPAQQAGLRRGDRILTVDGTAFHPVNSFISEIDSLQPVGPRSFMLELERDGGMLSVEVEAVDENLYDSRRSAANFSIQEFSAGNKTIAYFHPWSLSRNLNDILSFLDTISNLKLSDGLILDLRDSYGFLSIQHLDAFQPSRRTVFQITSGKNEHTHLDWLAPSMLSDHYGKPIAILIDGATAGGAELLAYQLAKLDRVTTVGEPTAGELGTYHFSEADDKLLYLPPAAAMVDAIPIQEFRVQPKLEIPYPLTQTSRSDPQFEAAFNVLLGRI